MMTQSTQCGRQGQGLPHGHGSCGNIAILDLADHQGDVHPERAQAIARGEAVTYVIAEQQFQGGPPRFVDFVGLALHDHAGFHFCATSRHEFAVDFNQANQARIQWAAQFQVAQCGDVDAQLSGGIQNSLPLLNFHGVAIDCRGIGG
jgi:hypothetical protein